MVLSRSPRYLTPWSHGSLVCSRQAGGSVALPYRKIQIVGLLASVTIP